VSVQLARSGGGPEGFVVPMPSEVTRLLQQVRERPDAAAQLIPLVYEELRRLASAQLSRLSPGQTLQPTALVHEAYLRLVGERDPGWDSRGHFFATAANCMREIIVDGIRRKSALKHGGGTTREESGAAFDVAVAGVGLEDALAVDRALERLEVEHPRQGQVVVMRYFGGLSEEEISQALRVTVRTVERDWRFARAWLHQALAAEGP